MWRDQPGGGVTLRVPQALRGAPSVDPSTFGRKILYREPRKGMQNIAKLKQDPSRAREKS